MIGLEIVWILTLIPEITAYLLFNIQDIFYMVIFSYILITFVFN